MDIIYLIALPSASRTVIFGNGTQPLIANLNYIVKLQAKNSAGVNYTTGGIEFIIEIKNKCSISGFTWIEASNARKVISPTINKLMKDNNDGTYQIEFTPILDGEVTILVTSISAGMTEYWYSNSGWSGSPISNHLELSNIDYDWDRGTVWGIRDDYVCMEWKMDYSVPRAGTYDFTFKKDDFATLNVDGTSTTTAVS